jgi:hypothetical protein
MLQRAAPLNAAVLEAHRAVHVEDDNVGVESAHKTEMTAEATARTGIHAHRNRKMKPYRDAVKAENKADRANLDALEKDAAEQNPQFSSNPVQPVAAKTRDQKGVCGGQSREQRRCQYSQRAGDHGQGDRKAAEKTKRPENLFAKHKKGLSDCRRDLLALILLLNIASSLSVLLQGSLNGVGISSYPSEDSDMLAAESQYAGLEAALQNELDHYESLHPGYDEYRL